MTKPTRRIARSADTGVDPSKNLKPVRDPGPRAIRIHTGRQYKRRSVRNKSQVLLLCRPVETTGVQRTPTGYQETDANDP